MVAASANRCAHVAACGHWPANHGTLLERGSGRCVFAFQALTLRWTDASPCR